MTTTRPDADALNRWFQDHLRESASASRVSPASRSAPASGDATSGAPTGLSPDGFARFDARDFHRDDAVLSVHFADGAVLHTAPRDWLARVEAAAPGMPTRGVTAGGTAATVDLPFELRATGAVATRAATRAGAAPIERYVLAHLTAPTTLDRFYQAGAWATDRLDDLLGQVAGSDGDAAAMAARQAGARLCHAFETTQLHPAVDGDAGALLVFASAADGASDGWRAYTAASPALAADRPVVVFLHGTASSTQGSFGALSQLSDAGRLPEDFAALRRRCTLLAWEHRSLSASPLRNAMDAARALAAALPPGATLHLVSHSRGGMVGDLLSLALLSKDDRAQYRALLEAIHADEDPRHPDAALIPGLFAQLDALAARQPVAGAFVRVASPSRGTLLADRRTDLFLSLLLRCVGLAGGINGNPAYETFNGFVRGFVAARADARLVPGLEAMIPGSALTLFLNATRRPPGFDQPPPALPGRLRVIAGDAAAQGLGGLLTVLGDAFYGLHDHDFVVHTHSMFGGLRRGDARSLRLERAGVHHLGYFRADAATRGPLFNALDGQDHDFRALADDERITRGLLQQFFNEFSPLSPAAWAERLELSERADRPIVIVLPGIMGSALNTTQGLPVWLDESSALSGRLRALELPASGEPSPLSTAGVLAVSYERLLRAADERYRVMAWPYDWRRSLTTLGLAFRRFLLELLERYPGRPVHLIAHSMGGLVARTALFMSDAELAAAEGAGAAEGIDPDSDKQDHDTAIWRRFEAQGGRLLMLGTPNTGSYAPALLLARQHRLSQWLAMAARRVTAEDMARWGARFAGLLQMLPADELDGGGGLLHDATWQALRRADGRLQLPDPETLALARRFADWRDASFDRLLRARHPRVLYVAGSGLTPVGLRAGDAGQPLRFVQSGEGDGTVPWRSRLDDERTWYADAGHGELADCRDAFAGYFELLETGGTGRLPRTAPSVAAGVTRGGEAGVLPLSTTSEPLGGPPSLPADPAAFVLGIDPGARDDRARVEPPIEVSVVHGSLDYARFPLVVGHHLDEHLAGGTSRVDEKLGGQLQRLLDLKLFVGADRTSAYLRPRSRDHAAPAYPGALVIGLGAIGALTPTSLVGTVTRGVLRYAFEHETRDCWVEEDGPLRLRLSCLLIGTHMQTITPRDSLAGLLMGVWHANQHLARDAAARPVRVAEIEIIEIHEHGALDAAYELERLLRNPDWQRRVHWSRGTLETRAGGLSGYRRRDVDNVWQRLIVGQQPGGGLKFELIAERARVEATQVRSDVASLSSVIQQMSDRGAGTTSAGREDERSLGQVLFQLLLPQALKGRMANFEPTVLVLDDRSAAYPWELITPQEDGVSVDDVKPLAVQAGLVRQRVTDDFRALPQTPNGFEALVIGDPSTAGWRDATGAELRIAPLPGAADEARAVDALLREDARPWRVTCLVGADVVGTDVRMALLAGNYRLLHLSAHGVVDHWVADVDRHGARAAAHGTVRDGRGGRDTEPLFKSGVLLSDQEVLSAADVEQMGNVPEFVFLNCCYSGRDGEAGARLKRDDPALAASLALQFIRMGAKAVVAAGWQVQDAAGLAFARRLYQALLEEGQPFGAAVLTARQHVRDEHGGNTWGAYQCYGDPNWRLDPAGRTGGARRGASDGGSSHLREAARSMSASELAERLLQVTAVAGDKPRTALRSQLSEVLAQVRADPRRAAWLDDSQVASALSQAWRELGDYALAVDAARAGTLQPYSQITLRDLQMLSNSLARLPDGRREHNAATAEAVLRRLRQLEEAVLLHAPDEVLQRFRADKLLPRVTAAGSERLCLQGSNLLRQASAAPAAPGTRAALRQAARCFVRGYLAKCELHEPADRRAYALSNALLCAGLALLSATPGDPTLVARLAVLLRRVEQGAHGVQALLEELRSRELAAQFWHYTASFELETARVLLEVGRRRVLPPAPGAGGPTTAPPAWRESLDAALHRLDVALVRWPSPSEKDSITMRLRLLLALADTSPDPVAEDGLRLLQRHAEAALKRLALR